MSVIIPDLAVYNYVNAGIEKMAYNNVCDDFYSYSIYSHFRNCPDTQEEAERLTRAWLALNITSYNEKYFSSKIETDLQGLFNPSPTKKPLTAIQTLKYLECISYQIEVKPVNQIDKNDLSLLRDCIEDLKDAIISNLADYKAANWWD